MENENRKMERGLKNRHLQMIALGGAIGTGLFYGSAPTIALAGPAIALSYLLGGTIIFFIHAHARRNGSGRAGFGIVQLLCDEILGGISGFLVRLELLVQLRHCEHG